MAYTYTAKPADLDGRCPYRLVDPAPHHYRVQGRLFGARWPGDEVRAWEFDHFADDEAGAQELQALAEAQGYRDLSIMAPQCDGTHPPQVA